jgi:hypothetical protein
LGQMAPSERMMHYFFFYYYYYFTSARFYSMRKITNMKALLMQE